MLEPTLEGNKAEAKLMDQLQVKYFIIFDTMLLAFIDAIHEIPS